MKCVIDKYVRYRNLNRPDNEYNELAGDTAFGYGRMCGRQKWCPFEMKKKRKPTASPNFWLATKNTHVRSYTCPHRHATVYDMERVLDGKSKEKELL